MKNERPALKTELALIGAAIFLREYKYNHGRGDTYWVTRLTNEREVRELRIQGKISRTDLFLTAGGVTKIAHKHLLQLTDGQLIDLIFD